ncbi:hypothetical protein [Actinomadura sp. K4S16]|uniref:hypothetical protein n=1 Tax=Actinomadura sp. K4S16 TaxID=1316147 RepID=UPI0011EDBFE2|nr:hypothetical protein [Actinomadura sp. K4S16]
MRVVTQYVTKLGAVADSPEPSHVGVEDAVAAAGRVLEMPDSTVILVHTISGGAVAVRVSELDHIAVEPREDGPAA